MGSDEVGGEIELYRADQSRYLNDCKCGYKITIK